MNTPKSMSLEDTSYTAMDLWSNIFGNSTTAQGNSQGYVYYINFIKAIDHYALTKQIEELNHLYKYDESLHSSDMIEIQPSKIMERIAELRKQQEGDK